MEEMKKMLKKSPQVQILLCLWPSCADLHICVVFIFLKGPGENGAIFKKHQVLKVLKYNDLQLLLRITCN